MDELEVWGELTRYKFNQLLKIFSKKYGKPVYKKRLSISFWDPSFNKNLDTRIRITNSFPEIVQKAGKWSNKNQRKLKEYQVDLPKDAKSIFNIYTILDNNIKKKLPHKFIQFRNYIFDCKDYEIKLTQQIGKSTHYSFEVELTNRRLDLFEIIKSLNLDKLVTITNVKFWEDWDKKVNYTSDELSDNQIMSLIRRYLED